MTARASFMGSAEMCATLVSASGVPIACATAKQLLPVDLHPVPSNDCSGCRVPMEEQPIVTLPPVVATTPSPSIAYPSTAPPSWKPKMLPAPQVCAGDFQSCMDVRCCQTPDFKCYRLNRWYAQCQTALVKAQGCDSQLVQTTLLQVQRLP